MDRETAGLIRATANGLGEGRVRTVVAAVRRVVGLQGQDVPAGRLAVRARTSGLVASDVDAAVGAGAVVRTWAMRGTLHLLAAADVGWVVGLLGPHFAERTAGRRRQLGLDEQTCRRGCDLLVDVLAGAGPVTKSTLVERLAAAGLALTGQAPVHLFAYAALHGLICRGPEADSAEQTYVLRAEWIGEQPAVSETQALRRLAERYVGGYGPAAAEDFAAWSGLPLRRARAAFAELGGGFDQVEVDGRPMVAAGPDREPAPIPVRLLGAYDTYLLGYRNRSLAVPDGFDRQIRAGGGIIRPAVLVAGRVVGTWRQQRAGRLLAVSVRWFPGQPQPAPHAEIEDLGRFLGIPVTLTAG